MKKTIERLLNRKELKRMVELDSRQERRVNPDSRVVSSEKASKMEKLLRRYRVVNKVNESSLKNVPERKFEVPKSIDEDVRSGQNQDFSIIDEKLGVEYKTITEDMGRLQSYEDLSKQYELTQEQKEAVGQIYGRLMEAEKNANEIGENYKQITEKVKEIADFSRRMMDEIGSEYINKKPDYTVL